MKFPNLNIVVPVFFPVSLNIKINENIRKIFFLQENIIFNKKILFLSI